MKRILISAAFLSFLNTASIAKIESHKAILHYSYAGTVTEAQVAAYLEDLGYDVLSVEENPKGSDLFYCVAIKDGQTVFLQVTASGGRIITYEEIIP